MKAYGEVGVPKGTPGRSSKDPEVATKSSNELYSVYGWIHESDRIWRCLIAVTNGKDQARSIIDEWNRTKVGPGQTRSTYKRDIETVRYYRYGEKVTFRAE